MVCKRGAGWGGRECEDKVWGGRADGRERAREREREWRSERENCMDRWID